MALGEAFRELRDAACTEHEAEELANGRERNIQYPTLNVQAPRVFTWTANNQMIAQTVGPSLGHW
jgi:hypothetical protein